MDRPTAREAIPVEGNPHQGHRRRMLDKFGRLGVDAFADHELLEVLLYYTIRQGDTNPVAHALMQHFGSLHAVLEATADQLCEVEGVGPRTAGYLSLISASKRRYQTDCNRAAYGIALRCLRRQQLPADPLRRSKPRQHLQGASRSGSNPAQRRYVQRCRGCARA